MLSINIRDKKFHEWIKAGRKNEGEYSPEILIKLRSAFEMGWEACEWEILLEPEPDPNYKILRDLFYGVKVDPPFGFISEEIWLRRRIWSLLNTLQNNAMEGNCSVDSINPWLDELKEHWGTLNRMETERD